MVRLYSNLNSRKKAQKNMRKKKLSLALGLGPLVVWYTVRAGPENYEVLGYAKKRGLLSLKKKKNH